MIAKSGKFSKLCDMEHCLPMEQYGEFNRQSHSSTNGLNLVLFVCNHHLTNSKSQPQLRSTNKSLLNPIAIVHYRVKTCTFNLVKVIITQIECWFKVEYEKDAVDNIVHTKFTY